MDSMAVTITRGNWDEAAPFLTDKELERLGNGHAIAAVPLKKGMTIKARFNEKKTCRAVCISPKACLKSSIMHQQPGVREVRTRLRDNFTKRLAKIARRLGVDRNEDITVFLYTAIENGCIYRQRVIVQCRDKLARNLASRLDKTGEEILAGKITKEQSRFRKEGLVMLFNGVIDFVVLHVEPYSPKRGIRGGKKPGPRPGTPGYKNIGVAAEDIRRQSTATLY